MHNEFLGFSIIQGDRMAKETVNAVRQAELNATQIEKEAEKEHDAILFKAEQDTKAIITSMSKEALAKAKHDLEQAQRQGEVAMETATLRAEKEIILLKEIVKSKEQAAIDYVLSEVI